METVAGVFQSRAEAEKAVRQIHSLGIPNDRIALLTPGMDNQQVEDAVPTADTEQPGMGKAMGGAVGGAMGVAGGATLGAAAASLLVPGVGPVLAGGILGAAILGAGGTATGMAAGEAMEQGLELGLPHDELYLYEDAMRQGRSVVIAFVEDDDATGTVQSTLAAAGAETIDAARESWWLALRDAEEADYQTAGGNFKTDETNYRRGFEAALRTPANTPKGSANPVADIESNDAFRRGYARGQAYQKSLRERYSS
jgi:hypothetical protein